jgi:xanthine dehydrogenase accessory factor
MELVLREIITHCTAGERVALCVVVGSRGSTPQEAGAKMLVLADGGTVGTLGGGCVEAEVRRRALELMPDGVSKRLQFRLDHDYGWD